MTDFQSISALYRNSDVFSNGIPILVNPNLLGVEPSEIPDSLSDFAKRVRLAMEFAKMKNQAALVKKTKLKQATISGAMNARKGASHDTTIAIAKACGVNLQWLVSGIGEMAIERPPAPTVIPIAVEAISGPHLIVLLGKRLAALDQRDREAVAGYLRDLALKPDDADYYSKRIAGIAGWELDLPSEQPTKR